MVNYFMMDMGQKKLVFDLMSIVASGIEMEQYGGR